MLICKIKVAISLWLLILSAMTLNAEDYGCLWWALGSPSYRAVQPCDAIPADYPGKKQILCFHTGIYGMAVDTINLNSVSLGYFDKPVPYEADIAEITELFATLPKHKLSIEVCVGGRIYRCVGRGQPKESRQSQVNFVEYGRYFQHVQITHLIMEDDKGERLNTDCWLEITSWPDVLNVMCYIDSKTTKPDKMTMSVGSKMASQVIHNDGESLVVLPLICAPDRANVEDVVVVAPKRTAIEVLCPESNGGHVVTIRNRKWKNISGTYYPEEHLDDLDKWPFILKNNTAKAKTFRLHFDARPQAITGFTSMILDEKGNPTGIPVQISKNWHNGTEPLRYAGPWAHGSTVITVPPMTTRSYQYAITYARWGGVPAASHSQLSLIGWGASWMWDEAAVGSFGESICYSPGRTQRRAFITDMRPFLVASAEGKKWGWATNAGGGDFIVYMDANGQYVPMVRTRGRYYSYGPNLTKVTYDEVSLDMAIKASYTVKLARVDDYIRVFQTIRYDVLKPMDFSRLAFCQMPADYYNDMKYKKIAIGNIEGLTSEWPVSTGSWKYDKQSVPMPGKHPWVSLHDIVPEEGKEGQAARGFIVRKWDAVLGSKKCALPHLSTYMTECGKNNFRVVTEIAPPPGLKQLKPGDYVEVDLELVVFPSKADLYYGPNENFAAALKQDVNTWKMVYREAAGNDLEVVVKDGKLLKNYPVEIAVSAAQKASFAITGGVGYVPITFAGLTDYKGYKLGRLVGGKVVPVEQGVPDTGFWQTDYDQVSKTWSMTYNINLDSSLAKSVESFVFGRD